MRLGDPENKAILARLDCDLPRFFRISGKAI